MATVRGLADYHTHTYRCGHAVGDVAQYVEAAIAAGLSEFGASEHIPLYWLPPLLQAPLADTAMPEAEMEGYVRAVLDARDRYQGDIAVRLGLEADIIPGHEAELDAILSRYPWDYVIGSCHYIGDWPMDHPDYVHRYDEFDRGDLYRRYFDIVCAGAQSGRFDLMAHLDLVKKFGHRPTGDASELYRSVAARLATAGVAVEISTAGLHKPVHEIYPHPDLLSALHAAGVPITISSDAHVPTEVGRDFDQALALARRTGYREFATFAGRKRTMRPLPQA